MRGLEGGRCIELTEGRRPPSDRRPSWFHCPFIVIGASAMHYSLSGRQRNAQRTFDRRKGAALTRSLEKRTDVSPLKHDA
ncbi:hypothetical protein BDV10DRAFT_158995 [Aspergillus recurvatus]